MNAYLTLYSRLMSQVTDIYKIKQIIILTLYNSLRDSLPTDCWPHFHFSAGRGERLFDHFSRFCSSIPGSMLTISNNPHFSRCWFSTELYWRESNSGLLRKAENLPLPKMTVLFSVYYCMNHFY